MNLLPDTDERAKELFYNNASRHVADDLVENYNSFRKKKYTFPKAYVMALYALIDSLNCMVIDLMIKE